MTAGDSLEGERRLWTRIRFAFWPYNGSTTRWKDFGAKGGDGASASDGAAVTTARTSGKGTPARDVSLSGLLPDKCASVIDLTAETLLSLGDAACLLSRKANGKRVHVKTIARWCLYGIQGIRLESLKVGRERYTSKEACQRFAESLTGFQWVARSSVDRCRADREAERRLKDEGF